MVKVQIKDVLDTMVGPAEVGVAMPCVTDEMGFAPPGADRDLDGLRSEGRHPAISSATRKAPARAFLQQVLP